MNRKCTNCDEDMEIWFIMEDYEEWFCNDCELYHEYKDGKLVKTIKLDDEDVV